MTKLLQPIVSSRLWALVMKESREILRNKYLVFLILVPPIVQLLILGAALDPQVHSLSMATVDQSHTQESRELVARLLASNVFTKNTYIKDDKNLSEEMETGKLNVGLVIPKDFTDKLYRGEQAQVQVIVDGADAYTAGIASSYVYRTINQYRPEVGVSTKVSPNVQKHDGASMGKLSQNESNLNLIDPKLNILYNPEQISSWFFVPGVLGACLTLTGTLVAAATILRERESGTMEQLLMTPASVWEILLAKVIPLVLFLLGDVVLAVLLSRMIFGMPCRGSMALLLIASALYAFCGIGVGMMLGSICRSQRQAQLASFFINIPLILLSGSVVPLDTMPAILQALSTFDPLRYYAYISRSILLKGATFDMLWQQMALLTVSAIIVLMISANRFRRQLV